MISLISQKRDNHPVSADALHWFARAYAQGTIPDYQAAALLMAIYLNGMTRQETADFTRALAASGEQLDLHDVAPFVVDKHSSGGVGDKTTLVVGALVAACGIPVGKMSGRGLGSSGGTLDKMEAVRGWHSQLSIAQFRQQLRDVGYVLAGQSADLAPTDGKLYALRDVTATVASTPLIAASIMSKKLAAGADAIVLDVKVGSGAFMPTVEKGSELAEIMVNIGTDAGRTTVALLSDMNQPLGHAIGNALELREAIAALRGEPTPPDLWAHCLEVGAWMVFLAEKSADLDTARRKITQARDSGRAFERFCQMVSAQGGDVKLIEHPERLPQANVVRPILSPRRGYLAACQTGAIGWACVELGGGRKVKSDIIDHTVGFILPAKVGMGFEAGDPLGEVHARSEEEAKSAEKAILTAFTWSETPVEPLPQFYGVIRSGSPSP